jgi:hypothetical protein
MSNMGNERILVKYSFDGVNFSSDFIPADNLKTFKDAFMNNTIFTIKSDTSDPIGASPFLGGPCNEKIIDMSKVVVIGF